MIRGKVFIIILLFVFVTSVFGKTVCDSFILFKNVKIVKVVDGDTFEVEYVGLPLVARLIGVDAFESKRYKRIEYQIQQTGLSEEEIIRKGNEAKKYFNDNYLNKEVCLILNEKHMKDPYGRYLGIILNNKDCILDNNTEIFQQIILRNGFGLKDYRYNDECEERFLFEQN
jgi:endonuclease YncB( thermonuclease family)